MQHVLRMRWLQPKQGQLTILILVPAPVCLHNRSNAAVASEALALGVVSIRAEGSTAVGGLDPVMDVVLEMVGRATWMGSSEVASGAGRDKILSGQCLDNCPPVNGTREPGLVTTV